MSPPDDPSPIKLLCEKQWQNRWINSTTHKAGWHVVPDMLGLPLGLRANKRKIPRYRGKQDDRYTKAALEIYRRMINRPVK
jgi:hypothetical protein